MFKKYLIIPLIFVTAMAFGQNKVKESGYTIMNGDTTKYENNNSSWDSSQLEKKIANFVPDSLIKNYFDSTHVKAPYKPKNNSNVDYGKIIYNGRINKKDEEKYNGKGKVVVIITKPYQIKKK